MRGELQPSYKQTEVGMVPEDWEVKTFESVAHIERGKFTARPRNDPKYYGGDIPFIQTGDVTNSSGEITTFSQTLNQEGLKVSKLFPRGTLFFTIAANIGDVGFAAFDTACPDSLVAITPSKRVNKRWLAHELRRRKKSFENLATHNAQLNINLEKLRPYLLPVPPVSEQEAIAEALSDADALIESLEQLITKKRQIKQGAMQELLTGKKRLPGFIQGKQGCCPTKFGMIPVDWVPTPLERSSAFITKGSTPTTYGFAWQHEGVLFLRSECVSERGLDLSQSMFISGEAHQVSRRSEVCAGDILMTITGNVGRVVHLQEGFGEANINQHIARIRIVHEEVAAPFVFYFLSQPMVRRYYNLITTGQAYPQISLTHVRETEVPMPSLAEQEAIATILS